MQANDASLNEWLDSLTGDYWIFGDFNFPGIVWEESHSDVRGREFLETVASKFLGQHVTEATHVGGHVLDLVMSSCENMVVGVEHQGRLGSSDHEILMCTLAADFLREDNHTMVRDFGRANFEAMKNDLRIDSRGRIQMRCGFVSVKRSRSP